MDVISLYKFFAALVFVLSLMGLLAFILKKIDQRNGGASLFKNMQSSRRLQVIERLTIDRQKTALILRIDDREYLVISSPSGDTVLECKNSDGESVSFNQDPQKDLSANASSGPDKGHGLFEYARKGLSKFN